MPIHSYLLEPSQSRPFTQPRNLKRQYLTQSTDSHTVTVGRNVVQRLTFDSLPVELQDEIFSFCLPPFPRFSVKEAPVVLTQVCRSWRSIVLSTPRLWSSFEVEIEGSGTSGLLHDARLMSRMKLWLEHSRCSPLSIRLVHNPVGRASDDRSTQLLVALVPEARRWRNAHFILPATSLVHLQHLPPNSLPTLQTLTFKVTGLRPSPLDLNISAMNIPWSQLTDLDLQLPPNNSLTLDDGLDILSKTVNLKRSTLHLGCTWGRHYIQRDKVSLPALETLHLILHGGNTVSTATSLSDRPEGCLVKFFNLLCVTKLRVLYVGWLVNGNVGPWSLVHPDFLAFLQGSAETLRELKMTYLPIAENELLACLSQLPRLTHLDLRFALNEGANDPITDRLLVACTIPSTTPAGIANRRQAHIETPLLPQLEQINLQCHGAHYTNATLLNLIQSRWKSHQKSDSQAVIFRRSLRSFRLLSMKSVPSEMEKNVKTWHDEGLEIDIQCLVIR